MNRFRRLLTQVIDLFYLPVLRKVVPRDTFRYAACGAINMGLDLVYYFIAFHYIFCERNLDLGVVVISPHIAALGFVFPITFFNGFWLNRNIAFRGSPLRGGVQLLRYVISVGGSLLLNYLCMKLFVEVCHIYPTPSKALTTSVTVIYSYMAAKYFTFRGAVQGDESQR